MAKEFLNEADDEECDGYTAEYKDGLIWVSYDGLVVGVYRTWEEANKRMEG